MSRKKAILKMSNEKVRMIDALTKSLGIVTIAAKDIGISRQTHYDWYNHDTEYQKAVDDLSDVALDFAESMLHKQIQDKDTIATIFYLKTKGKRRGYIERQELMQEINVLSLPSVTIKKHTNAD